MKYQDPISPDFLERARQQADGVGRAASSGSGRFARNAKRVLGALVLVGATSATAYVVKETRDTAAVAGAGTAADCGSARSAWLPHCAKKGDGAAQGGARLAQADGPATTGTVDRNATKRSSTKEAAKKPETETPPAGPASAVGGSPQSVVEGGRGAPGASAPAPQSPAPHAARVAEKPLPEASVKLAEKRAVPDPAKAADNRAAQEISRPAQDRVAQAPARENEEAAREPESRRPWETPRSTEGAVKGEPARTADVGGPERSAQPDKAAATAARSPDVDSRPAERDPIDPGLETARSASLAGGGEAPSTNATAGNRRQRAARNAAPDAPVARPSEEPVMAAPEKPAQLAKSPEAPSAEPRQGGESAGLDERATPMPPVSPVRADSDRGNPNLRTVASEKVRNRAVEARRKALEVAAAKAEAAEKEAAAEARQAAVEARRVRQAQRAVAARKVARAEQLARQRAAVRTAEAVSSRERRRAKIAATRMAASRDLDGEVDAGPGPRRLLKYRLVRLRVVETGSIPGGGFPPEFSHALRQYNGGFGSLPW